MTKTQRERFRLCPPTPFELGPGGARRIELGELDTSTWSRAILRARLECDAPCAAVVHGRPPSIGPFRHAERTVVEIVAGAEQRIVEQQAPIVPAETLSFSLDLASRGARVAGTIEVDLVAFYAGAGGGGRFRFTDVESASSIAICADASQAREVVLLVRSHDGTEPRNIELRLRE